MIQPAQYRRLGMMALLLVVGFAGLGYRLVDLQIVRHEDLSRLAAARRESTIIHPSRRGDILDAKGNVLATCLFVKTVCADPSLIGTNQLVVAHTLAPLLRMSEPELAQRLQPRVWTDKFGKEHADKYVPLKRKVTLDEWEKIQAAMKGIAFGVDEKKLPRRERGFYQNLRQRAIFTEPSDDQLRVYPGGTLAAHVLGFTAATDRVVEGAVVSDLAGRDGIEAAFNSALSGTAGWRQTENDRRRRELVLFREEDVAPRPGLNVVLTLDATVQDILEAELAKGMELNTPVGISGIVLRPKTGAILAMASLPSFNPNQIDNRTPIANLRNRIVTDTFEPGSTFKAVVVSAALNEQVVSLSDIIYCENGLFPFAGHTLHDAGHHFGNLTVEDIIAKSSNIGAAKVGMKLGEARLYKYIRDFGFGFRTGIALPGEVRGTVRDLKDWYKVSIAQIPMGQGIAVTPLQMTMAISAIANGGRLMQPMLVDHLEDERKEEGLKCQPQVVRQVVREETARLMVQAMKKVVLPGGTAPKAALEHYTAAGKTGTGQKPPYNSHKYFSSFIGFLPADDPEICIAVFLDEPDPKRYYGGETAGPIFKAIAERAAVYLGVRPDGQAPFVRPLKPSPNRAETIAETDVSNTLTTAQTRRNF
jgi:cell division protein FtsI/penicillin-binding protein 2